MSASASDGAREQSSKNAKPVITHARDVKIITEAYEVLEKIGHGGFATVARARERASGREVAIKVRGSESVDVRASVNTEGRSRRRNECDTFIAHARAMVWETKWVIYGERERERAGGRR